MINLQSVRGVIWDLDGTLYRFDELFKTACNHAAAKAACTMRPSYIYEEAFAKSVESEQQYGFSLYWFHQETNIAFEDMHFVYHDAIDETIIARNDMVGKALRQLELPSVILTNSSHGWVSRILKHLNLHDIFGDGKILALEDVGFEPKSRSTTGFEKAANILGLEPSKILLVEDLPRNLIKAKEAGLQTMLLHHGQIPVELEAADYIAHDVLEVLDTLNDNRGQNNYSASLTSSSKRWPPSVS
jgi:FMN phosphatase YigB (HAD superfamily)